MGLPNRTVATVGTGAITTASFASGAIDAAAIAANAIGASELATDAVTEIAAGILDRALTNHTTAGTLGGDAIRREVKTMTYATGAGTGSAGTPVNLFTVTGRVLIISISPFCTTLLTESGATATIALGITGATTLFIAATNAVDIDANEYWGDTTPDPAGMAVPAINLNMEISASIINTIAGANVTAGVVEYTVRWVPLSAGATLVAA